MTEELGESELGSQEYWEKSYKTEVSNYRRHGDVGEIWFGEDIVDRLINWFKKSDIDKTQAILDVGCGNGMLLVELSNEGYTNLSGVDYSESAIALSKEIAQEQKCAINFDVRDVLNEPLDAEAFDVVHDKGTYDAISLSAEAKENRATYITNVHRALKQAGVLIITSCNWTESELIQQFEHKFALVQVIPTPQFNFGGKVGGVVSSVVFRKKL